MTTKIIEGTYSPYSLLDWFLNPKLREAVKNGVNYDVEDDVKDFMEKNAGKNMRIEIGEKKIIIEVVE